MTTDSSASKQIPKNTAKVSMRRALGGLPRGIKKIARLRFRKNTAQRDLDALYRLLYGKVHDHQSALDISSEATREAFSTQWSQHETGNYLLSDPWFKENVDRILVEEELQVAREWFRGKKILDAGCGNGRWTYGFLKLGAEVTCVDVNESAIEKTRAAASELDPRFERTRFLLSPLEDVAEKLADEKFDLVFSWGVIHHCRSYNQAFDNVCSLARDGGMIYLYLYGRETIPLDADVRLFAERVYYNSLLDDESKMKFLLEKAGGDRSRVHNVHDIYAPLINRRLAFQEVEDRLHANGFVNVTRTIDHSEIFVRATMGDGAALSNYLLPPGTAPYWFEHHE